MMDTDTETVSENLTNWKITSLTRKEMRIALTFAKPLSVSSGDEKDTLVVFSGLGAYADRLGYNFPEFQFLQRDIPRQHLPESAII